MIIKKETRYEFSLNSETTVSLTEDEAIELRDELTKLLVDTNR